MTFAADGDVFAENMGQGTGQDQLASNITWVLGLTAAQGRVIRISWQEGGQIILRAVAGFRSRLIPYWVFPHWSLFKGELVGPTSA